MSRITRYSLIILGLILGLHYLLGLVHPNYRQATSISFPSRKEKLKGYIEDDAEHPETVLGGPIQSSNHGTIPPADQLAGPPRRANATFVMLARNTDLDGAIRSIRALEDRFNSRHGYPYVFLNEEPFSDEFKRRVSVIATSTVEFGVIPTEHWIQPDWIDEDKARAARARMVAADVKYGGSVAYRNMCRFNSGFFFNHELLQKYRWYWRVEPSVQFHCNLNHDPFLFMEDNNKVYGWTIAVYEITATIRSLWGHVTEFMAQHPEYVAEDNAMGFLSHNGGKTYNRCHFWSNFEIADMDFWRGPAYTAFFDYLDSTGGFYYERWGDAPVHSIAASLFLKRSQIHFFEEIGYQHDDWSHCPLNEEVWEKGKCACEPRGSFDYDRSSCKKEWDRLVGS